MKLVEVEKAVGLALAHDVTEIARDRKRSAFRRGHVVSVEDIPQLLNLGKRHLYVADPPPDAVHENDGALRLARAAAGPNLCISEPREGKAKLTAEIDGFVRVRVEALRRLNALRDVICVTRRSYHRVEAGDEVAAVRVMPLLTDERTLSRAEAIACAAQGLVEVKPPRRFRAGLVVTGSEVVAGRIEDAFEPVIREKLAEFGSQLVSVEFSDDRPAEVQRAIRRQLDLGCDMVIATGGMSVDPDDRTPAAIRRAADRVLFQWAPALPGCMNMLGLIGSPHADEAIPILGVPACGIHHRRTVLDLILLRLAAGVLPDADEVGAFGHGGLCLECEDCRFPNCAFGSV